MTKTEKRIEMVQLLGQLREGEEKPGDTVLRALRHLAQSPGAETALLQLCINHGFATGHGDTLADIIREIDAQIPQWFNSDRPTPTAGKTREMAMPEGFTLEDTGRMCRLDDPDCRHPDCDCARYMNEQRPSVTP